MIKRRKNNTKKKRNGKGFKENGAETIKINASTVYETFTEQLSPFGGLLPLIFKIEGEEFVRNIIEQSIEVFSKRAE